MTILSELVAFTDTYPTIFDEDLRRFLLRKKTSSYNKFATHFESFPNV